MNFTDFAVLDILDLKDALYDYNKELLIKIENNEDTSLLSRAFEESGIINSDNYKYASTYIVVIGPKVFVGNYDISSLIHDTLIGIKGFNELINPYYERLSHCLDDLSHISKSRDDFAEDVFKKYLSRLEKLYRWDGKDLKEFRTEIKRLTKFKRDCELTLTYKISNIDMQDKINACKSSQEAFKLITDIINDKSINDFDIKSLQEHFEIELPGPKEKMGYTKFLEEKLSFDYKSSTKYFNGEMNIPNLKQICLYLALYVEIPVLDKIERFLNVNSISLKGIATLINDYSNVSDKDICYMLSTGFNRTNILLYLSKWAFTKQRYIKP